MKRLKTTSLSALSIAALLALAACGGGGDGGSSSTGSTGSGSGSSGGGSTPVAVTGTLDSPQYAQGSAQLAAFNLLNQYRTQCGFPALKQNTVLDQAAQNHAKYMGLNNAVVDTEVSGNQGYTGASYIDRAVAAGFPSSATGIGVSVGVATGTGNFTATQFGQQAVYSLLAGVYHSDVAAFPVDTVGIGEGETQTSSGGFQFTNSWMSLSLLNTQMQKIANSPATFPCEGVTGVPHKAANEIPMPPNISASGWGTPIAVMGNLTDAVVLQSASVTGPSGAVAVQVLNASTDPNKELGTYQAVAYPTSPLSPNTTYSVTLNGTVNGTAFSRSFSFTTGS
ncbi:MAG: CAP domain-containing protein [Burkholderia contaminans]|uniref:Serine protease n=1 Tax=Burkholderia aenigmatica TaxID=2015348 RepID=A0A228HPK7_9BURK|nr:MULTISPECIES: CAP domain-containing protein [Burkholderia cepacia complex]KVR74384.1 serine protease [Burkholderia vietnamiensis]KVS18938.1 serine protease [Burkholderia vietnamiensis]MBR8009305.1 CAP domain-containing protein [Burkholderia vietnamiensis]MBR8150833.1 CAP domain-containing protein [Burkholderia vietnamiensis]MBR8164837.1 CAP domain-containing protein [Burkholderia vietnamiensis]